MEYLLFFYFQNPFLGFIDILLLDIFCHILYDEKLFNKEDELLIIYSLYIVATTCHISEWIYNAI